MVGGDILTFTKDEVKKSLEDCLWELSDISTYAEFAIGAMKSLDINMPPILSGDGTDFTNDNKVILSKYTTHYSKTIRSTAMILAAGAYERYLSKLMSERFAGEDKFKIREGKIDDLTGVQKPPHVPSATTCLKWLANKQILNQNDADFMYVYKLCDYRHLTAHNNSKDVKGKANEIPAGTIYFSIKKMYHYALYIYQKAYQTQEVVENVPAKKWFEMTSIQKNDVCENKNVSTHQG